MGWRRVGSGPADWPSFHVPMPARPTPEPDLWRREHTPLWRVLLPLILVMAALVALVLVPRVITERNEALRAELIDVLNPLARRLSDLERSTGAELAAARGYALTGDPFFVDRFLAVHSYGNRLATDVDSLARIVGGDVASATDDLLETRAYWAAANFGQTRSSFRDGLPEHQRHFDATMAAARQVGEALAQETDAHTAQIRDAERLRSRLTSLLAVAALLAAGSALMLGWRLHRSSGHLLRRAREETALRGIAQMMADAEQPADALKRIVDEVARITMADRVAIEQVDRQRGEVEVVARTGGEPRGVRAPLAGSLTERVLASGEVVLTDREHAAEEPVRRDQGTLMVVPLLSEGEAVGALLLDRRTPFGEVEALRTRLLADMAAVVLRHLRLFDEVRTQERELQRTTAELRVLNESLEDRVRRRTTTIRRLARALTLTEQREREQLAQVLHDDLQQLLYAMQLQIAALEAQAPLANGEPVTPHLVQVQEIIAMALGSTRHLTADLSPHVQPDQGLADVLSWLAAHVHERFGCEVAVEAPDSIQEPQEDLRAVLFRIVRELLFNAVKHGKAQAATIRIEDAVDHLTITVRDHGKGFDPAALDESMSTVGGFGLARARERIALFGGSIRLDASPGAGTRATITVPIDPAGG